MNNIGAFLQSFGRSRAEEEQRQFANAQALAEQALREAMGQNEMTTNTRRTDIAQQQAVNETRMTDANVRATEAKTDQTNLGAARGIAAEDEAAVTSAWQDLYKSIKTGLAPASPENIDRLHSLWEQRANKMQEAHGVFLGPMPQLDLDVKADPDTVKQLSDYFLRNPVDPSTPEGKKKLETFAATYADKGITMSLLENISQPGMTPEQRAADQRAGEGLAQQQTQINLGAIQALSKQLQDPGMAKMTPEQRSNYVENTLVAAGMSEDGAAKMGELLKDVKDTPSAEALLGAQVQRESMANNRQIAEMQMRSGGGGGGGWGGGRGRSNDDGPWGPHKLPTLPQFNSATEAMTFAKGKLLGSDGAVLSPPEKEDYAVMWAEAFMQKNPKAIPYSEENVSMLSHMVYTDPSLKNGRALAKIASDHGVTGNAQKELFALMRVPTSAPTTKSAPTPTPKPAQKGTITNTVSNLFRSLRTKAIAEREKTTKTVTNLRAKALAAKKPTTKPKPKGGK